MFLLETRTWYRVGLIQWPLCLITAESQGIVEDFLYGVDVDGSSLLHLAANSGVLGVSMRPLISSVELSVKQNSVKIET